ncbi:hypothetical protein HELRODRAFT_191168 [Helobdella robusta]|uniref:Hyccin n=1 Tax=Helobdella robusta TaxID=6412 RepID=T1FSP5_HELRO|nr:hypothetical protein HELRODRAFT_191168 [Helobdella robusta]ESO07396.1 hypothetical protein HELRODRAFT_191168 [Helobdella robusta]
MAIAKWLATFKMCTTEKLLDFAEDIKKDHTLKKEIFFFIENKNKSEELDPVVHQLFNFYRLDNDQLKKFSLEFIPAMLLKYYSAINGQQVVISSLEAFLLGMYNLDSTRLKLNCQTDFLLQPNSALIFNTTSSIYHDIPMGVTTSMLTRSALDRWHVHNSHQSKIKNVTYLKATDSVTNKNKLTIMIHALQRYNEHISDFSDLSHLTLCKFCMMFTKTKKDNPNVESQADNNIMPKHNGQSEAGLMAVSSLYKRAHYDLLPASIMSIGALMSFISNAQNDEDDDNNGDNAATTTTTTTTSQLKKLLPRHLQQHDAQQKFLSQQQSQQQQQQLTREAITNATFRTQTMPEDIEVKGTTSLSLSPAATISGHVPAAGSGDDVTSPHQQQQLSLQFSLIANKVRQKSMIAKVFHKKKDDSNCSNSSCNTLVKRNTMTSDDLIQFLDTGQYSQLEQQLQPPLQQQQQHGLGALSSAKKTIINAFKSEFMSQSPSASPATTPAAQNFHSSDASRASKSSSRRAMARKNTISIAPYFADEDVVDLDRYEIRTTERLYAMTKPPPPSQQPQQPQQLTKQQQKLQNKLQNKDAKLKSKNKKIALAAKKGHKKLASLLLPSSSPLLTSSSTSPSKQQTAGLVRDYNARLSLTSRRVANGRARVDHIEEEYLKGCNNDDDDNEDEEDDDDDDGDDDDDDAGQSSDYFALSGASILSGKFSQIQQQLHPQQQQPKNLRFLFPLKTSNVDDVNDNGDNSFSRNSTKRNSHHSQAPPTSSSLTFTDDIPRLSDVARVRKASNTPLDRYAVVPFAATTTSATLTTTTTTTTSKNNNNTSNKMSHSLDNLQNLC